MWTPFVTCPTGTSSSGQRGKSGAKRRRLTFPCRRLTPLTAAAPADGQIRHVETLRRVRRVLAAQGQQIVERDAKLGLGVPTEVLLDEGRSKTIEPGGHRRVRGEEVAGPRDGQRDLEGLTGLLHETPGAFQHGEGRMPFIQMAHVRPDAEFAEQTPSADPKDDFLHEPQLRPASVELARNPPVRGHVRRVIAVQQVELRPADLNLPGAQPDRVTG